MVTVTQYTGVSTRITQQPHCASRYIHSKLLFQNIGLNIRLF